MGTEHKKVDTGAIDAEITEDHVHPVFATIVPSGCRRRGAIHSITAVANGDTITVGTGGGIIYTFETVLTAAGAGAVHVKLQGTIPDTLKMFAKATRGDTDAVNISYGAGTQPNPSVYGYFTSLRFSIGTNVYPATIPATFNHLFFRESPLVKDRTDAAFALTLAKSAGITGTVIAFIRTYSCRYIMDGNAAALGDRVAGQMQMVVPMFGYGGVYFDPDTIVVEATSNTSMIVEADLYYSTDEAAFTLLIEGVNLSRETAANGSQQYHAPSVRAPPNAGLYVKMRSNVAGAAENQDFKVQLHTYPLGV